jgi:hypothetical protein
VHAVIDEHDRPVTLSSPNDCRYPDGSRRRDQPEPFQRSATGKSSPKAGTLIPAAIQPVVDGHDTTFAFPADR